jgi:hypothetical protein
MTTKSATEQYAAIKVNHVKYLDELKIVDANLVRIRPLLEAEKGFNKLNGTKINFIKEEFRVAKDEQLRLYGILKKINADLRALRAGVDAERHTAPKGTGSKKAPRDPSVKAAAKAAKEAAKEADKAAKKAAKEAERERTKAERDARREARREELEFMNKPACGYNFPLLTDAERAGTKIMNQVFAKVAKSTVVGPGV